MKILFCPCHYVYDGVKRGSEINWAYTIADKIATTYPLSTIVTGFSESSTTDKIYKIITLQADKKIIDLGIINSILFNTLYTIETFKLKKSYDIVHHVLPFGMFHTYNFSFIFKDRKQKYIIGPIQSPIETYADNIHDISSTPPNFFVRLTSTAVFTIFAAILRLLSKRTLQSADKLIVIDRDTKNLLIKQNIATEKIQIIPPGVDTDKYYPSREDTIKFTLITSSALIERKQVQLIIKSFAIALKKIPNLKLIIVGDGPQKESLQLLSEKLNIQTNITFVGLVANKNIHRYYHQADMYLNMSKSEGFATVSLESLASGLALISTSVGGFKDVIQEGVNGYIINQDEKIMAKKLEYLYSKPRVLTSMKKESRAIAMRRYSWEKIIIPQYVKVYSTLLK